MSPVAPVTSSSSPADPSLADPSPADSATAGPAAPESDASPGDLAVTDLAVTDASANDAAGAAADAAREEAQMAAWLVANPGFFDRFSDVLADVRLRHPHGGRAVSLVERQVLVLREKNRALEQKMADLIRIGQENDAIGLRLQHLTRALLQETDRTRLPGLLLEGLMAGFAVPQVAIRLWGIGALPSPWTDAVDADTRQRVDAMTEPYCGPNAGFAVADWLAAGAPDAPPTASIAQLPLRREGARESFGLIVLGSDDAGRFQAGMGTAFLARIAEIASASLARLVD